MNAKRFKEDNICAKTRHFLTVGTLTKVYCRVQLIVWDAIVTGGVVINFKGFEYRGG